METATKTRFTFKSDDETLVGNLFLRTEARQPES
jgi:hypothetical protein